MKIPEILKTLRQEDGLTQNQLAKNIGIGQSTIVGYERGDREPTASNLIKYANYFNVSMDYLVGRTDELGALITSPAATSLSDRENRVLALFRKMSFAEQNRYIGFGEGLLGFTKKSKPTNLGE